jgi:transglutaminase-like putative cysteine protease
VCTPKVISELQAGGRRWWIAGLLSLTAAVVTGPAGAAGADLFIGQFVVEDARAAPQQLDTLQYYIVHEDPGLLEAQLAGWISAPGRSQHGVSFRLNAYPVAQTPVADRSHLASSFLIDYLQPSIQALRSLIETRYGSLPSPAELEEFVYGYIEDKNVARGFDVASIVAQSRSGDCSEHAVLLTALLRMYGYPARTVIGVFVSLRDPVLAYGHAWAEYHDDRGWAGVDGTRIDDTVGMHYIPLGVISDESIAYRMAVAGTLRFLSIEKIRVE